MINQNKRFHMLKGKTTFIFLTLSKNIPDYYFKYTSYKHFVILVINMVSMR